MKDLDRLNSLLNFLDCAKSSFFLSMSILYDKKPLLNTNSNSLIIISKFNCEALSRSLLTSTVFNTPEYSVVLAGWA